MEDSLQPPAQPDPVTFTTDFGVEFGLLTCFDVLFHDPAVAIHEQKSVSNFIMTTAWIDMLPFHTGDCILNEKSYSCTNGTACYCLKLSRYRTDLLVL